MKVETISITVEHDGSQTVESFNAYNNEDPCEQFFNYLLEIGKYTNIKATKEFDTPARVMDRLKGRR